MICSPIPGSISGQAPTTPLARVRDKFLSVLSFYYFHTPYPQFYSLARVRAALSAAGWGPEMGECGRLLSIVHGRSA
ncbi:hypothetical protein QO016_004066 [Methylobacterium persicinum]|uniref:Uncharacterized protein n=1 Tax=Methylobacterium persicinum TaxID=374426 RepID=A0ABU0HRT4_9HYPH|nr:hypothetical protein [Methylobacterium persicinum]GJE40449.1 hypothetical protein KHHGKMAE_4542 [Methylobacterium persicinum]